MKHSVMVSDLRGSDIRPPALLSELRERSVAEARRLFLDAGRMIESDCPGCDSSRRESAFARDGFEFARCRECRSVYVSPRPTADALAEYYRESSAVHYRAAQWREGTAAARRGKLLRSLAQWIGRTIDEIGPEPPRGMADFGTNDPGWIEEARALDLFNSIAAVEPNPDLASECRMQGAEVSDRLPHGLAAVTSFAQLEHQFSPAEHARAVFEALAPGGVFFLTTRTITGFDLQTLGGRAAYIYVPEHLNLLSLEGLQTMLESVGFEIHELGTPGQLDVDFVRESMKADPTLELPPFIDYLLTRCGREAHDDFQAFLQKHRLSSHVRVAAMKPR